MYSSILITFSKSTHTLSLVSLMKDAVVPIIPSVAGEGKCGYWEKSEGGIEKEVKRKSLILKFSACKYI